MPPDQSPNKQVSDSMVALAIEDIRQKVIALDAAAKAPKSTNWRAGFFELAKTFLASWPGLGLVLLILFYTPIHVLLTTLAGKVNAASELHFAGASLIQNLEASANKAGNSELSKSIPKLSSQALAILLATTQSVDFNSLKFASSWGFNVPGLYPYQSDPTVALFELAEAKFGVVYRNAKPITKSEYLAAPEKKPGSPFELMALTYTPTDLGLQARDVILLAVARNLEQAPPKK